MEKVDLKKEAGYAARLGRFDTVQLPPARYLQIDGSGDPNTALSYAAAVAALFAVSYAVKFHSKRELGRDYAVMPLEALWTADDLASFTSARDRALWQWTVMIRQPDWIPEDTIASLRAGVEAAADQALRDDVLDEGLVVQTLHVGPYADEGPVLARLHEEVLPERGLVPTGMHHEIYLGDPRRSAPERLRTILRQPVAPRR